MLVKLKEKLHNIKNFLTSTGDTLAWRSAVEVFYLAGLAFLPLIFSIIITSLIHNSFKDGIRLVVSPGELLAFTVSFTAPTIFFFFKSHGEGFKLPALKLISFITLGIYVLTICILLIAKNNWVPELTMDSLKKNDNRLGHVYIYTALTLMGFSLLLWFYRVYYSAKLTDYVKNREQEQNKFNTAFSASLEKNIEIMPVNLININVIKLQQPVGEFFIGNVSARDLVEITFTDVRRIEERDIEKYLGIQRPLDKVRVKQIKQYLRSPDASFPTGIILSIDQNCAEFDETNRNLKLRDYNAEFTEDSIPLNKVAKVLDGQHRIAAFTNEDGSFDETLRNVAENFHFNVVIFVGIDIDEQANIFATVNLAQTKVNKSLVYDLEGLSKTRSPFRSCHQIAVALDSVETKSPLYHRIKRLGVKTVGRDVSEPLTQAVFVESLIKLMTPNAFTDRTDYMKGKPPKNVSLEELKKYPFRNLFIDDKDTDIAVILFNYFSAIKNLWPTAWAGITTEGNILPRSNAFKAFMRYLRTVYLNIVGTDIGRVVKIDEFVKAFSHIQIADNDFTSGNFKPGSGGESDFYKLLTGEKTIQDLKN